MKLYFIEKEISPGAWAYVVNNQHTYNKKKEHYTPSILSCSRYLLIPALIEFAITCKRYPKSNYRLVKKQYTYMETKTRGAL